MNATLHDWPVSAELLESGPKAHPKDLRVDHLQLSARVPSVALTCILARETLVYCLTGRLRAYTQECFLGTYGGRRSMLEPQAHVLRFPAGTAHTAHLVLESHAADCLIVTCKAPDNGHTTLPYLHTTDTAWHTVGTGTHQRLVGEVPTPPGFAIACGQTIQEPGTTSSWPAHATDSDLGRYVRGDTTWEEYFYVVCAQTARIDLDGFLDPHTRVDATEELENGTIRRMPLGSHPVTAAPDGWCSYIWCYIGDALTKEYNRSATDVRHYRK